MCDIHTHDMKEVTVTLLGTINGIPYHISYMIIITIHKVGLDLRQNVSSPSLQTLLKPRFGCFGQVSSAGSEWCFGEVMEFLESNKSNNTCFVSLKNLWRSNVCTPK